MTQKASRPITKEKSRATRAPASRTMVIRRTRNGVTVNGYRVLVPTGVSVIPRARLREAVRNAVAKKR